MESLGTQVKETLYGLGKNSQKMQWKVYVDGDTVTAEFGQVGGKLRRQVTVVSPKNVGRSNETTVEQQAILEAESKWRKKYDKYYRPTFEEVEILETSGVMLAENYVNKPHLLEDTYYASRKLNGVRCKSVLVDGVPRLESRGAKPYKTPEHLVKPLTDLHKDTGLNQLDGELYIHGHPLGRIQSAVKKTTELTSKLEFHVFDVPLLNTGFEDRLKILEGLAPKCFKVKVVEYVKASKSDLEDLQKQYRSEGYEGVMLRNVNGQYMFRNKRSNDLLKYKLFQDSEAKVISVTKDKLDEGVLTCQWGQVTFDCKMVGTHEYRSYDNMLNLVGLWINFTYSEPTEKGLPEFPVGRYVRECDEKGNPIE